MDRLRVAVLGATGLVGQLFAYMLAQHPWFEVEALAASPGKAGVKYKDAVEWHLEGPVPEALAGIHLVRPVPDEIPRRVDIVFSALPSSVAVEVEPLFAKAGFLVVSNASPFRMEPDVPLIVPEINPEHLQLLSSQRKRRGWRGALVKNPNCSTAILVLTLKPLLDSFGVRRVVVTTMQALSGAGYRGVPGMAILDNILPHIPGEEDKLVNEPRKILGSLAEGSLKHAEIVVSATTTRVPTLHGHLESVHVELAGHPSVDEFVEALASFRGLPQELGLPTAPAAPVVVRIGEDRPQPRLDRDEGGGMSVVVGRVHPAAQLGDEWYRYMVLGHNLVRGAAGNAILIAELLVEKGAEYGL